MSNPRVMPRANVRLAAPRPKRAPLAPLGRGLRELGHKLLALLPSIRLWKLFWGISVLALTALLLWGGLFYVRQTPAFALQHLHIEGNQRFSPEQVAAIAQVRSGMNLFSLDRLEAEARLRAHPWIAEARIERRLPDRLEIRIREERAVAILAGDLLRLVSEEGQPFKTLEEGDPVDLPLVSDYSSRGESTKGWVESQHLRTLVETLKAYERAGVERMAPLSEAYFESDHGLSLVIGHEATLVRLGQDEHALKVQRLGRILQQLRRSKAQAAYIHLDNKAHPERAIVGLQP